MYAATMFAIYTILSKSDYQNRSISEIIKAHFSLKTLVYKDSVESNGGLSASVKEFVLLQHLQDLRSFSQVCLLKFILTEGEKIVIFYFTSGAHQDEQTI